MVRPHKSCKLSLTLSFLSFAAANLKSRPGAADGTEQLRPRAKTKIKIHPMLQVAVCGGL
jgi:hypothetical protein